MKLEEGMYVRTKDGHIDKIVLIDYAEEKRNEYPNHPSKNHWRDKILLLKAGYWRTTQNIIKASHNIIELIEVGDYVNGKKIESINFIDKEKIVRFASIDGCYYKNKEIESIVTKEQFESMLYKVQE